MVTIKHCVLKILIIKLHEHTRHISSLDFSYPPVSIPVVCHRMPLSWEKVVCFTPSVALVLLIRKTLNFEANVNYLYFTHILSRVREGLFICTLSLFLPSYSGEGSFSTLVRSPKKPKTLLIWSVLPLFHL